MKSSHAYGYGPGYCYWAGKRAVIAIAEDLETVRLMVAPHSRIRATKPHSHGRGLFIIQLP